MHPFMCLGGEQVANAVHSLIRAKPSPEDALQRLCYVSPSSARSAVRVPSAADAELSGKSAFAEPIRGPSLSAKPGSSSCSLSALSLGPEGSALSAAADDALMIGRQVRTCSVTAPCWLCAPAVYPLRLTILAVLQSGALVVTL